MERDGDVTVDQISYLPCPHQKVQASHRGLVCLVQKKKNPTDEWKKLKCINFRGK